MITIWHPVRLTVRWWIGLRVGRRSIAVVLLTRLLRLWLWRRLHLLQGIGRRLIRHCARLLLRLLLIVPGRTVRAAVEIHVIDWRGQLLRVIGAVLALIARWLLLIWLLMLLRLIKVRSECGRFGGVADLSVVIRWILAPDETRWVLVVGGCVWIQVWRYLALL